MRKIDVKIGDKIICKKCRNFNQTINETYEVISYDHPSIIVTSNLKRNATGYRVTKDTDFYRFYDYFITLKEHRLKKLHRLEKLQKINTL